MTQVGCRDDLRSRFQLLSELVKRPCGQQRPSPRDQVRDRMAYHCARLKGARMKFVHYCASVLAFGAVLGLATPATPAAAQAEAGHQDYVVLPFPAAPFKFKGTLEKS